MTRVVWCCPLMEPDAGVLWVRDKTGSFEKVGHGGRVLRTDRPDSET